jgi:hypothetical protein
MTRVPYSETRAQRIHDAAAASCYTFHRRRRSRRSEGSFGPPGEAKPFDSVSLDPVRCPAEVNRIDSQPKEAAMLILRAGGVRLCDGLTRREAMLVGASDALGLTLYDALGIDPSTEVRDRLGRPMPVCAGKVLPVFSGAS